MISYIKFSEIQDNMVIMINCNQPMAFHTIRMWLRIIWRIEYFFVHIQPGFTILVWNGCEVNVCRKSFELSRIIRCEFDIYPMWCGWYDFLIPVAKNWFRFWTYIWPSQVCYQCFIFIQINLLYWYVITIKIRVKLK